MRAFGHGDRAFVVDAVEHAQPLCEAAVVFFVLVFQELGDFDKRNRLLVVEHLVLFVLEPDAMAVVGGIGETVEHLEADEVQVAELVAVALDATCNDVLRGVVNQAALERVVIDMLHFEHDAVPVLIVNHDVRDDVFCKRVREGGIHEGNLIDAVGTVELEHSVEEIHCNRFVFGSPEKQLEDAVVVDIDVIVNFLVLCDAGGDVTPGLVRFGDVLEHFCILFSVHKESFAAWAARLEYVGTRRNCHQAICVNPAIRRFKFGRFYLKPSAAADGICIAAYSAWVFQGGDSQAIASVNAGPTTARRNVPARGCVRLGRQVLLVVI